MPTSIKIKTYILLLLFYPVFSIYKFDYMHTDPLGDTKGNVSMRGLENKHFKQNVQ